MNYFYDNQALPPGAPTFASGSSIGRLVAVCYGGAGASAGSYTGYDKLGRVNVSLQQTNGINYNFLYSYNLASEMTSETYPSGRVIQTEFDTAGRLAGVKNQAGVLYYAGAAASDATNRIQYAPHGAVSAMRLGNGKVEHTLFNNRLQPYEIGLGANGSDSGLLKLEYTYSNSDPSIHDNNGNVLTQKITAPKTDGSGNLVLTQIYGYDSLNRLSSASENSGASWSQNYGFDRFGNRWMSQSTGYTEDPNLCPTQQNQIDAATNRINKQVMTGYDYDASGNQIRQFRNVQSERLDYDAEGRLVNFNSGVGRYSYDGEGHRVKKIDANGTTVFVYHVAGQLVAEYIVGTASGGGTSYLTGDHLGSTRVVTDSNGNVKSRHDYLPFGEEIGTDHCPAGLNYGAADGVSQKFTSKERDTESGLDYFGERYYSSAQGRFTSADPLGGSMRASDPQTMNRFVFVLNNPLRYVDPDGLESKTPWEQLTQVERNHLLRILWRAKGQTAADAFNRLVTVKGNAQATATNIAAVQDFIVAAGGYKNSKVWQDITKIVRVEFQGPPPAGDYPVQSSEIHVLVADKKTFLADLQHEGYAVNTLGDWLFRGKYHPFDNASAFTPRINDPEMHFANNKANDPKFGPDYFFAHWDRKSVNSGEGGPIGDAVAGSSHKEGLASPQAVRDYLKRTNQSPH